jgi:DNA-binding CsgD family transcriptional regulator
MPRILIFTNNCIYSVFESSDLPGQFVEKINAELNTMPGCSTSGSWQARLHNDLIIITSTQNPPSEPLRIPRPALSEKEKAVLQCLADGDSVKEISLKLQAKPRMVRIYISQIKTKFRASTSEQTVGRAVALGICLMNIQIDDNFQSSR